MRKARTQRRRHPVELRQPSVAIIGTRGYPSYYGGFETSIRHLAPFLAEKSWEVLVYGRPGLSPDDPGRDRRVQTRITRGLESRSLSTLTYGFTSAVDALIRKPDVALVMNCANGFWLPLLKLRGIPTLVNVDGMEWERGKWGRVARFVFKAGARCTALFADELVFDAYEIGRRWRREFRRDGVFVPYGGEDRADRVEEPEFTPGEYVLFVARLVEENSVSEFLDAIALQRNDCDVVIVGSANYGGPLEARVRSLAESDPRIHWLGHVRDDRRLFDLWRNAGAYFHGHSVGGTNPALVQAMALGAATVARDTPYNREVLADAGRYVAPNASSIQQGIDEVLKDPVLRIELSKKAKERADRFYTWIGVNTKYEAILAALANGSSTVPMRIGQSDTPGRP